MPWVVLGVSFQPRCNARSHLCPHVIQYITGTGGQELCPSVQQLQEAILTCFPAADVRLNTEYKSSTTGMKERSRKYLRAMFSPF